LKGCPIVISQTVLVVAGPFGDALSAEAVARAIGRGLVAGGRPQPDLCPIEGDLTGERLEDVRSWLDALDFDARMRRARAVVLAEWRLEESTLRGSAAFEIATRARQGGVPAYAVSGENALAPFDARILDLQVILEAGSKHALVAAGTKLARLVGTG
jgi:glycerate kinase